MEAGRALDALVAEKVMGWKLVWRGIDGAPNRWKDQKGIIDKEDSIPPYSTDIAAAWKVVDRMRTKTHLGVLHLIAPEDCDSSGWVAHFEKKYWASPSHDWEHGETPAHAICKAALKAIGLIAGQSPDRKE